MDRMKTLKLSLVIMAAALLTIGLSGMAYAFHSGGVAECGGCHSMHAPQDTATGFLLIRTDFSSTCLDCHAHEDTAPSSYHVMTYPVPAVGLPPVEMTPGGDFGWLLKPYSFVVRGTTTNESGMSHGHNVVAADFGITPDNELTQAPGGTFLSTNLACTSCHDPHGKYRRDSTGTVSRTGAPIIGSGSYNNSADPAQGQAVGVYRLLAGLNYSQNNGNLSIPYPGVPVAVAPSTYNRTEAATQTRVAYGVSATSGGKTTWGLWCGGCHPNFHSTGNYVHPIDQGLGTNVAGIYNTYIKSGDLTGTSTSSYLSLVPFMENTSDIATLKGHAVNDDSQLGGPISTDQVSCLSCHRAHASGFPNMLRWSMESEFMVSNGVYQIESEGRTTTEAVTAYYGRQPTVFASYQRVLCNKCHAQD
jgi:predicted CXXCH cytochrome family protein